MPWRAKSRSTFAFCSWMRRVWRRVLGGRRREVRGFEEGDVRVDVCIWRMGVISRVVRIWEEMWDS